MRAQLLAAALLASLLDGACAERSVFVDPEKNNKHLKKCTSDSDCTYERFCVGDSNDVNKTTGEEEKLCLHKTLFPDFSPRDLGACFCIFFGTILAASAGIGGGGLNAPVFLLITGFIIQEATPLSHATVMGNSLAQLVINFRQRHPLAADPGKPLIDYAVPLILLPPQLGGNNLGVLLNPMIPANILIILAELLLFYATVRVFQKAHAMFAAESAAKADEERGCGGSAVSHATSLSDAYVGLYKPQADDPAKDYGTDSPPAERQILNALTDESAERRAAILADESKVPWKFVGLMAAFWVLFASGYVGLKESSKCSGPYWGILGAMYPVLIGFTFVGYRWIIAARTQREAVGLPPVEGDIEWTVRKALLAPVAAGGVGTVAGILGLGGGELMAPLLLELGMLPKAASATSAYMIVWTTSSDLVHYAVGGDLPTGYAVFFACLGFMGGLVGRYLAIVFVQRYNRQSVIAYALGVVLTISMILFAYRAAVSDTPDPWWPFQGPC